MKPLTIETLAEVLAAAWAHALPGKESVERDSVSALDRFADLSRTSSEVREVPQSRHCPAHLRVRQKNFLSVRGMRVAIRSMLLIDPAVSNALRLVVQKQ